MELFGIENVKKLIRVGCAVPKQISVALADGKITIPEYFGFTDEIFEIIAVAKSFKAILNEIGDISEEEKLELKAFVKEEFDIPADQAEAFWEDAIVWAFSTASLVKRFQALRNAA